MSEVLFIRPCRTHEPPFEWHLVGADQSGAINRGTAEELSSITGQKQVVFVVPAESSLLTSAQLTAKSARSLASAIPYAVEDQLAEDVEAFCFTHTKKDEAESFVAVVRRDLLAGWLQTLRDSEITPDQIVPEALLIPHEEDEWSVVEDGGVLVVRTGPYQGFGVEIDHGKPLLARLLNEGVPDRVRVWSTSEPPGSAEILEALGLNIKSMPPLTESFQAVSGLSAEAVALDWRSSVKQEAQEWDFRYFRWAAALLLAAFVLHLAVNGVHYFWLHGRLETIKEERLALFRETFPEIRRIEAPLLQAQQQLQSARQSRGQVNDPLLAMMGQVTQAMPQSGRFTLTGLEFRQDQLLLRVQCGDVSQAEEFKSELAATKRFTVELLSAVSQNEGVDARFRIKEAGS